MNNIINWQANKVVEDGCGGTIYKIVDVDNSNLRNVEIAMCIFAPGEIGQLHYHKNMEEIYFVLEGEGEIVLNGISHTVKTEDAVAIPAGTKHQIRNTSQEKSLRFVAVNSPSWSAADMIPVKQIKDEPTRPV
jgi:mannose-6-phosphate isomerase-like protein (cupin superfamily)